MTQETIVDMGFWNEYQAGARRTLNDRGFHDNVLHCALGMSGEIGELITCTTPEEFIEELGDFMWYAAVLFGELDAPFGSIMQAVHSTGESRLTWVVDEGSTHYLFVMVRQCSVVVDKVKRQIFYGKKLDVEAVAAATGIMVAAAYEWARIGGGALEDAASKNLLKLKVRYPDKFTEHAANNRDTQKEGEVFGA